MAARPLLGGQVERQHVARLLANKPAVEQQLALAGARLERRAAAAVDSRRVGQPLPHHRRHVQLVQVRQPTRGATAAKYEDRLLGAAGRRVGPRRRCLARRRQWPRPRTRRLVPRPDVAKHALVDAHAAATTHHPQPPARRRLRVRVARRRHRRAGRGGQLLPRARQGAAGRAAPAAFGGLELPEVHPRGIPRLALAAQDQHGAIG
mmetsp:Transcript_17342/g.53731  ORF Transcript_17342/g.53731 Transcript_17342/m.53731 type:complete len:206 (-) Transcript_17342:222-839(-)